MHLNSVILTIYHMSVRMGPPTGRVAASLYDEEAYTYSPGADIGAAVDMERH